MAYTLNLTETFETAPETLKPAFRAGVTPWLSTIDHWYADDKWNKSEKSRWQISCSLGDFQKIIEKIGPKKASHLGGLPIISGTKKVHDIKGRLVFDFTVSATKPKVGKWKLRFRVSGKTSPSGAPDAKNTSQQERGSKYIFEQAILHGRKWSTPQDLMTDTVAMSELRKIYPGVTPEWVKSYWAQNATLQKTFSSEKWKRFDHTGGFMEFIKGVLKNNFGDSFSKISTWNPADIWLVKNFEYVKKQINDAVQTNNDSKTIEVLNSKLRALYKGDASGRVVGISLKKVTKGVAQYRPYNVDEISVGEEDGFRFKSIKYVIKLDQNMTQDSLIHLKNGSKGFKFQIKANDSSVFSNLKWESSMSGFGAARAGKAPVDMVIKLLADNGKVFKNSHSQYPKSLEEFQVPSTAEKYAMMFWKVRQYTGSDIPSVASKEAFKDNMKAKFASQPHVANSKLMQLAFLECVCSLGTIKSDIVVDFWMDMCFLALKKGKKFGPFGKLF